MYKFIGTQEHKAIFDFIEQGYTIDSIRATTNIKGEQLTHITFKTYKSEYVFELSFEHGECYGYTVFGHDLNSIEYKYVC